MWRLVLVVLGLGLAACGGSEPPARDAAGGALAEYASEPAWEGVVRSSHYLPMRDGTRIAIDLTLPAGLAEGQRLPSLLHQTRYWRGVELRWPLSALGDPPDARAERFVRHGYALVSVDARGSGASFGWRPHPWSADEQRDAIEVVDWIVHQPWSNGRVAAEGESYDGTAAELLASQGHPAVRAAAPRFSLYDGYLHMPFPGGVPQSGVLEAWSEANSYLDAGSLPPVAGLLNRLLVRGVRPAHANRDLLAAAIRDHERNPDVAEVAATGAFRDDVSGDFAVNAFSPHARSEQLERSGVPFYSWSGWFDGGMPRAAVERFRAVRTPGSRLLLGPWNHGAGYGSSPTSPGPSDFDAGAELRKFFDPALRDVDSGIADDPPVHYYTLVEDRWKAADDWPPPSTPTPYYLGEAGSLTRDPPSRQDAFDRYDVDFAAATGDYARWDSVFTTNPVSYPQRARRDERLLSYTSAPLDADLEVTGHPVVMLHITSTAEDGAFFAYLEDVAPDGSVSYVTEGMLRALHRRLADGPSPLGPGVPHHSYRRADALPLVPGQIAELAFDLQPVSYLFRRGHAIRLALAGADRDHFVRIPAGGEVQWQLRRDRSAPSRVVLPAVGDPPRS